MSSTSFLTLINSIQKPYIAGDYLPASVSNIIQKDGKFKPPAVSRKRKRPSSPPLGGGAAAAVENESENGAASSVSKEEEEEEEEEEQPPILHAKLESVLKKHDWQGETLLDYLAYLENLKNFHHKVTPATRASPIYKFLAFTLNHRHAGRCILSMYGARFDMLFVINTLIELNFKFECLPVGTGVIMLKIPSLNQVYLDAYKFFQQPLSKLPKRFGLPDGKGMFCYAYYKIANWNLTKKQPPPFSYYVNPYKDNEEVIAAKKRWYEETKLKEESFNFNHDCLVYCKLDVKVLLMALVSFLAQSFPFQDLLVKRYGRSPAWKKGKMSYFHLFTQQTTIGSYR